jgi:hypothetical protein
MRWRVDTGIGDSYVSYSDDEKQKAWDLYEELTTTTSRKGVRIRKCRDIFDDGLVIKGPPIIRDLTEKFLNDKEKN